MAAKRSIQVILNWFWTFKRITIELILLNPTKFEQIRKFENFRMKKKRLKKVRKLKLPLNYPCIRKEN